MEPGGSGYDEAVRGSPRMEGIANNFEMVPETLDGADKDKKIG